MTAVGLGMLWLIHFLPFSWIHTLGKLLGGLLFYVARERRRVGSINLKQCFPQKTEAERTALLKAHFGALCTALLEYSLIWWASPERLKRLIRLEGLEHLEALKGEPVLLLGLHFTGLDMGASRLSMEWPMAAIYTHQKNPILDAKVYAGRVRFQKGTLLSRQEGLRSLVRAMRQGNALYYLPDQDFGRNDSIFVDFFGIPTATITGFSRLAKLGKASVVPFITHRLADGTGYVAKVLPPWEEFPTEALEADARRLNAFVEEQIQQAPEQYFWLHKRFKTRPEGEARWY